MTMRTDTMRRQKKSCPITEAGIRFVDYKDERLLARFITDNGKILPSRLSGVDATSTTAGEGHQEGAVSRPAAVRARTSSVALVSFSLFLK